MKRPIVWAAFASPSQVLRLRRRPCVLGAVVGGGTNPSFFICLRHLLELLVGLVLEYSRMSGGDLRFADDHLHAVVERQQRRSSARVAALARAVLGFQMYTPCR